MGFYGSVNLWAKKDLARRIWIGIKININVPGLGFLTTEIGFGNLVQSSIRFETYRV